MNVIIFSKDRSAQLHACLESFYKHVNLRSTVTVIYVASNSTFDEGYKLCQENFKGAKFVREVNFKQDLIRVSDSIDRYVMFLVDDIIFTNPISKTDKQIELIDNPNILTVSLRLHLGITRCYATDQDVKVPKLVKGCVWDWTKAEGDWGYPMSVDGNIYRWKTIASKIASLEYNNPNTFEAALNQNVIGLPVNIACYPEGARLINIPANRVQSQFENRFADSISAEELNQSYLNNKIVDIDAYSKEKYSTVHCPLDLVMKEMV